MAKIQFSIRTLLASVAAVGIGAALWVAEPSWYVGAMECLLLAWVSTSAAIISVNSKGKAKPFWMGVAYECVWTVLISSFAAASMPYDGLFSPATFPAFLGYLSPFFFGMSIHFRPTLTAIAFAPALGLLCVFTHCLLIRPPQGPKD